MNKKALITVLIFVVLVVIGIMATYIVRQKNAGGNEAESEKIYVNDKYGFEIKYPNDWKFESSSDDGKFLIKSTIGGDQAPALNIRFVNEKYFKVLADEQKKFNEWQKESVEQPSGKISDIKFGGVDAKEFLYYSAIGVVDQAIILEKNGYAVILNSYKDSILDSVLATFRFTK
ncbi:MAG: PsbP-related protein [Patescibacteria group bacterium]